MWLKAGGCGPSLCKEVRKYIKLLIEFDLNEKSDAEIRALEQIEVLAYEMQLGLQWERDLSEENQTRHLRTSYEWHDLVKNTLNQIADLKDMPRDGFYTEESNLWDLFRVDLMLPHCKLVIEINGVRAFYPYTRKQN